MLKPWTLFCRLVASVVKLGLRITIISIAHDLAPGTSLRMVTPHRGTCSTSPFGEAALVSRARPAVQRFGWRVPRLAVIPIGIDEPLAPAGDISADVVATAAW